MMLTSPPLLVVMLRSLLTTPFLDSVSAYVPQHWGSHELLVTSSVLTGAFAAAWVAFRTFSDSVSQMMQRCFHSEVFPILLCETQNAFRNSPRHETPVQV